MSRPTTGPRFIPADQASMYPVDPAQTCVSSTSGGILSVHEPCVSQNAKSETDVRTRESRTMPVHVKRKQCCATYHTGRTVATVGVDKFRCGPERICCKANGDTHRRQSERSAGRSLTCSSKRRFRGTLPNLAGARFPRQRVSTRSDICACVRVAPLFCKRLYKSIGDWVRHSRQSEIGTYSTGNEMCLLAGVYSPVWDESKFGCGSVGSWCCGSQVHMAQFTRVSIKPSGLPYPLSALTDYTSVDKTLWSSSVCVCPSSFFKTS